MDRKSLSVLVVSFLVLMLWYPLLNHYYPPTPPDTNLVQSASTDNIAGTNGPSIVAGSNQPSISAIASNVVMKPQPAFLSGNAKEETVVLENAHGRYVFSSFGGGLKKVELKEHLAAVGSAQRKGGGDTNLATLNQSAPYPLFSVITADASQGDGVFTLKATSKESLRAEKILTNGLVWTKEYRLSSNYLVEAQVKIENRGAAAINLGGQEWSIGTATPMNNKDNNITMLGVIDYNGSKSDFITGTWFANNTLGCIPGVPRTEYVSATNVSWAAVHNQFFTIAHHANSVLWTIGGAPNRTPGTECR